MASNAEQLLKYRHQPDLYLAGNDDYGAEKEIQSADDQMIGRVT